MLVDQRLRIENGYAGDTRFPAKPAETSIGSTDAARYPIAIDIEWIGTC